MPPRLNSRYTFCTAQADANGNLFLSEREPFVYQALSDNILHTVAKGETLYTLAARYYSALSRPAGLWWIIGDFQPDPIFDPTVALEENSLLVIPSLQTVLSLVFSEDRRIQETV